MLLVIFFCTLFGALLAGVPVAITLLFSGATMLYVMDMYAAQTVAEYFINGANSFPLMAIPFFMLTGEIMKTGGMSHRIVDFAMSMVGHIRGGLGYVVIISGLIFAGLSGSAIADTAALGAILIPMMMSRGYSGNRTTGILCAAGIIAVVLPPSIPMIVFGVVSGASITRMFMGGIVPGFLMAAALWITWRILSRNDHTTVMERKSGVERWRAFYKSFPALLLPLIIIVGLRGGIFTPTEAGVVAAVYAGLVSMAYRELDFAALPEILLNTIKTTSMVMFIAAAAMVSAYAITVAQIPDALGQVLKGITTDRTVMMLMIMGFLLLIGCVMDLIPAVLIFIPVLMPIVKSFGIDPAYFGVMVILNLAIGLITPPIGTALYVGASISKVPIIGAAKGVLPFIGAYVLILLLMVIFPSIVIVPMYWLS